MSGVFHGDPVLGHIVILQNALDRFDHWRRPADIETLVEPLQMRLEKFRVDHAAFQPLDLLGMIGFIILLGLVVNNAILLVAQTRTAESRGMTRPEAVRQALRLRLRPIFMSTLTSLFGMLPLLIVPGSGSEIYRGMAAAIVGGMSVSTIFPLILLPSLLQLTHRTRDKTPETASLDKKLKPAE